MRKHNKPINHHPPSDLRKGQRGSLKECDINRHKVMSKSGIIIPIPFLNTRISHTDTL